MNPAQAQADAGRSRPLQLERSPGRESASDQAGSREFDSLGLPPRPSSTSQLPSQRIGPHQHPHHHHHHHPPFNPFTQPPLAIPNAEEIIRSNFIGMQGNNVPNLGGTPAAHVHSWQQHNSPIGQQQGPGPLPMRQFQQAYNQQHQVRTRGEQQPSAREGPESESHESTTGPGQADPTPGPQPPRPASETTFRGRTTIQEGQMPGGQWRMVVNQTTTGPGSIPPFQAPFLPGFPMGAANPGFQLPGVQPFQNPLPGAPNPTNRPGGSAFNLPPRLTPQPQAQLQPQGTRNITINYNTTAYVLSSPHGPEALLLSPSGAFSSPPGPANSIFNGIMGTPGQELHLGGMAPPAGAQPQVSFNPLANNPVQAQFNPPRYPWSNQVNQQNPSTAPGVQNSQHGDQRQVNAQNQQPNQPAGQRPNPAGGPQPAAQPQPAQPAEPPAQAPAAGPAAAAAQDDDIFRVILGLGGHLWLLVRLFGFFYLFTSGAPWSRTILIGLATILVFLAQNRALRPFLDAVWVPFRRHIEDLVQEDAELASGAGEGNAPAVQDTTAWARMRRTERTVVLFFASVLPGIGERRIAAREEAARRRAQPEEENRGQEQQGQGNRADGGGAAGAQGRAQEEPLRAL